MTTPTHAAELVRIVVDARAVARSAHEGQTDKVGEPYFDVHVADVAARVAAFGPLVEAVAWLHDVAEDTEVTVDDLRETFPAEVADAVDALTRRPGEQADDYYARVKANPVARTVKVHGDIPSNADPERLALLPAETRARLEAKYAHALAVLR